MIDARRADRLEPAAAVARPTHRGRVGPRRRRRSRPPCPARRRGQRLGRLDLAREQREHAGREPAARRSTTIDLDVLRATSTRSTSSPRSRSRRRCSPVLDASARARSSTSRPTPRSRPTRAGAATARRRPRSSSSRRSSRPSSRSVRVLVVDPGRHAHRDAPGRVPRRGHLRPAAARGGRPAARRADRRRPAERSLSRSRSWCHDRRARHPAAPLASRSTPRSKRTSRPRSAAAAATTCACSCPTAPTASRTRRSPSCPRTSASRRRHRRQHVGDDPRRDRGNDCPTGVRDPRPLLDRAARRPVARRGAPARRRHDRRRSIDDLAGVDVDLAGGGHLHAARTLRRLAATLARGAASARRRCSTTSSRYGEPIRYRHAPGPVAARRVPADLRRRAGERGDAERVAAVHARDRRRPRAPRRHDRADPLAHRRVLARRHEMPYPERYRVPDATAATS